MDGRRDVPRRDGDLLADVPRGTVVAVALLAVGAAASILVATDPASPPLLASADRWWRTIAASPSSWLDAGAHGLYVLGSGAVMVPLRLAVAGWLAVRRRRVDLAAWLLGWVAADLITQLLKPGIGRLRPDLSDASSFPSAHAKSAAQVAVGLVLLLPFDRRAWGWGLAVVWIALMAASRTVLDEHWMSDVIAGAAIGAGCAVGAAVVCQRWRDARAPVATTAAEDAGTPA
jgi:undecaprenyl-diphosphatase